MLTPVKARALIPELIYRLIRQSVPNANVRRIPYGSAVNQPGLDGVVECERGYFQFVPDGNSCWEIGTGSNPQTKATDDFGKCTERLSNAERANLSFVSVTPHSAGTNQVEEPKQTTWIKKR